MLDTHSKIIAMSFQGKDFTPAMKQLVMNLKRHFDEERKNHKEVSTRNPTWRTAQGLDIGEITVKSIRAEYRHHGHTLEVQAATPRGKPDYRAAVNLQPVIRAYVRTKNFAGHRVGVGQLRQYLLEPHNAAIPSVTLWRTLQRWGFTSGTGKRRSALKERDDVVLARRRYLRQKRANRTPDGSLQRPEVYLDETFVNQNHAGQCAWYLEEDGPWVNTPSGKGPRLIMVHAMTVADGAKGQRWSLRPRNGQAMITGKCTGRISQRGLPSNCSRISRHAPASSWTMPLTTMSWWKKRSPRPRVVKNS